MMLQARHVEKPGDGVAHQQPADPWGETMYLTSLRILDGLLPQKTCRKVGKLEIMQNMKKTKSKIIEYHPGNTGLSFFWGVVFLTKKHTVVVGTPNFAISTLSNEGLILKRKLTIL